MGGQRIGYVRVSSFDQKPDRQLESVELEESSHMQLELDRRLLHGQICRSSDISTLDPSRWHCAAWALCRWLRAAEPKFR